MGMHFWPLEKFHETGVLPEADPECIYYVRSSKHRIRQVRLGGPYYPLHNVIFPLQSLLKAEHSSEGLQTLNELIYSGNEVFLGLEWFDVVLTGGDIMKLEVLSVKNPKVVAALPCDVWSVVVARGPVGTVEPTEKGSNIHFVEYDKNVQGTFTSVAEANKAAEIILQEVQEEEGLGGLMERFDSDGRVHGGVFNPSDNKGRTVEVRCSQLVTQPTSIQPSLDGNGSWEADLIRYIH